MLRSCITILGSLTFALLAHASPITGPGVEWPPAIEVLSTPAGTDSAQPQLTVSAGGALLSWIERAGDRAILKFSERTLHGWTPAVTAASGSNWFVNWADVPSVLRLANGTLVAHWLQKSGTGTYAYDVRLSYSTDQGRTWSTSFTPHHDGTQSEHGFASLFQVPGSGLGLVWLDGRAMTGDHGHEPAGEMSLRFGAFDSTWKQRAESSIDVRVCECCPTAAAISSDGPIVAFRDRAYDELRNIHVARFENNRWTESKPVHDDGWRFPGCPVNGPSLSARGRDVAIAWFTAKDNQPTSLAAFSSDAGRSFAAPIVIDESASLGRVDIDLLPDGSAVAAYVASARQGAEFRVRRVQPTGTLSQPITVAALVNNRASGYPRMAVVGNEILFAWTDRQGTSQVRTARAPLAHPSPREVSAVPFPLFESTASAVFGSFISR